MHPIHTKIKNLTGILFLITLSCYPIFSFAQESFTSEFVYAEKLYRESFYDLAAIQFNQILEQQPPENIAAKTRFYLAECHFASEKWEDALNAYTQLILRSPESPWIAQAYYRLGECDVRLGRFTEAGYEFNLLYEKFSQTSWAILGLRQLGDIAVMQGRIESAIEAYQLYIRREKESAQVIAAKQKLADLYVLKGDIPAAITLLISIPLKPGAEEFLKIHSQLGRIYAALHQYAKAAEQDQLVLKNAKDPLLIQTMHWQLGELYELSGQTEQAVASYQSVIAHPADDSLTVQAATHLGLHYFRNRDWHQAIGQFEAIETMEPDSGRLGEVRFLAAQCYSNSSEFDKSIPAYLQLIEQFPKDNVTMKCRLFLARDYIQTQSWEKAALVYRQWIEDFPDHEIVPHVLFQLGKLYVNKLGRIAEGLHVISRIWEGLPSNPLTLEAKFYYANILDDQQNTAAARNLYESILLQYPSDSLYQLAEEKITRIDLFDSQEGAFSNKRLVSLLADLNQGKQDSTFHERLAEAFEYETKEFDRAIDFYRMSLSELKNKNHITRLQEAIGRCYLKASVQSKQTAFLDSATASYKSISSEEDSTNARIAWKLLHLHSRFKKDATLADVQKFLHTFPNSPYASEALYLQTLLAIDADSISLAWSGIRHLLSSDIEAYRKGHALSNALIRSVRPDSAAEEIALAYGSIINHPAVYYSKAVSLARQGKTAAAIEHDEMIMEAYGATEWAEKSMLPLGERYIQIHSPKAVPYFEKQLLRDRNFSLAYETGLSPIARSQRQALLKGLIAALITDKQFDRAGGQLVEYLRRYHTKEDRIYFNKMQATIAEDKDHPEEASFYLNALVEDMPSDSLWLDLGELYLRQNDNDKALNAFEQCTKISASEKMQLTANAKMALVYFSEDEMARGSARFESIKKSYEKQFGDRTLLGEILLEKGRSHFRKKDFNLALETFEQVAREYKNTPVAAKALLETGRTLLVTNHIDEALKLLTSMLDKYPGDPVLGNVYLNLGDHYFRSQQYENALAAFKNAMRGGMDPEAKPLAMRYCIRLYETVGLYDAGLAMIRDYLDLYPYAEDRFEKQVKIGLFYFQLKDFYGAIKHLKAIEAGAEDADTEAEIQYWIGKSYLNMGQFEQAIFEFLKVKYMTGPTKLPWASTAVFEAAKAYGTLGDSEKAIQLFEKVVQTEGAASDLGRVAVQQINALKGNE